MAERHDLLEVGRQIVQAMDPSEQDKILDELQEIRTLLVNHCHS